MNDSTLPSYYWMFILLVIPIVLWIRYTTSLGKRSQRGLSDLVGSLQKNTAAPLFVCIYGNQGNGILLLEKNNVSFINPNGEVLRLANDEISTVEYSDLGFCHIVTEKNRHKFAYIHHAKDAKGVFTMVFGPAWRDDDAMRIFVSRLEELKLPNVKVDHSKLLFLPQIKI